MIYIPRPACKHRRSRERESASESKLSSESLQLGYVPSPLEDEPECPGSESHRQLLLDVQVVVCASCWHLGGFPT